MFTYVAASDVSPNQALSVSLEGAVPQHAVMQLIFSLTARWSLYRNQIKSESALLLDEESRWIAAAGVHSILDPLHERESPCDICEVTRLQPSRSGALPQATQHYLI